MKKLILYVVIVSVLKVSAQESKTWRLGIQWGFHGNQAQFVGGSVNADGRFTQKEFDGAALSIIGRYDYNKHWMAETGFGFNTFGFNYSISQNYSLLNPESRFQGVNTKFAGLDIPFLIFYKFNPNCKNSRWLIGAGFATNFIKDKTIDKNFVETNEANFNSNILSSSSFINNNATGMLRLAVGREKIFKNGSFLNATLVANLGLNAFATSTVNYTIDGVNYEHQFTNQGNFIGLRVAYFFGYWGKKVN